MTKRQFTIMGCILMLLLLLPTTAKDALALPPRPTPPPPSVADPTSPEKPAGSWIELHLAHTASSAMSADGLWTVVQWQDKLGNWHDVEGWQGNLDKVEGFDGFKTWWVAERDFGNGPFRWVVYRGYHGAFLSASESFNLPSSVTTTMRVELSSDN